MPSAPQLFLCLVALALAGCGGAPGCAQMARQEAALTAQRRALARESGDVLRLHLKAREVAAREVALSNAQEDRGCG
jgi:hypothetical protein